MTKQDKPVTHMALCLVGPMSMYGNGPDEKSAIDRCLQEVRQIEKQFGGMKDPNAPLGLMVFDYIPYSQLNWTDSRVFGVRESDGKEVRVDPEAYVWVKLHTGERVRRMTQEEFTAKLKAGIKPTDM